MSRGRMLMKATRTGLAAAGLAGAAALCGAQAQPTVAVPPVFATPTPERVEQGREQFHRTCAQCHGRNMVNSGTTVYDLRRFPVDQPERFWQSVTQGKGNMPSFKEAITPEQLDLLWSYVATRGGKEY